MKIIDITTKGPKAGGVCVGGPMDGITISYFSTEMPVYEPCLTNFLPDASRASVSTRLLGSYLWIGGGWRWSPSPSGRPN